MVSIKRVSALLLCLVMTCMPVISLAAGGEYTEGEQAEEANDAKEAPGEAPAEAYKEEPAEIPADITEEDPQSGWTVKIWLDGEPMNIANEPKMVNGSAYVSIHDFCVALGCTDVWENGGTTVRLGDELYIRCEPKTPYITANDRVLYMPDGSVFSESGLFVPVRILASIFNMELAWDQAERKVSLVSKGGFIECGATAYDEEDLYWLSRIINAESGGEPLTGKIAVGNVVLNRVKSSGYPNTVHNVVFDTKNGVQFVPAKSGSINKTPSAQSVIAAKLCLEGANTAGNALYFIATSVKSSWVMRNRTLLTTIGHHRFYL